MSRHALQSSQSPPWAAFIVAITGLALAASAHPAMGGFEILPLEEAPGPLLPLHLPFPFGTSCGPGPSGLTAGFLHLRPFGMEELRYDAAGLGWTAWNLVHQTYATRLGSDGYQELEWGARVRRRSGPGLHLRLLGTFPDHALQSEWGVFPLRAATLTPSLSGSAGRRLEWSVNWRDALGWGDASVLGLKPSPSLRMELDLGQGWRVLWAGGWSSSDPGRNQARIALAWSSGSSVGIGQDWSAGLNASWIQAGAGGVQGQAWTSQTGGGLPATTGLCVALALPQSGRPPDCEALSHPGYRESQRPPADVGTGLASDDPAVGRTWLDEIPDWMDDGILLDGVPLFVSSDADSLGAWSDSLDIRAQDSDVEPPSSQAAGSGRAAATGAGGSSSTSAVSPVPQTARLGWQDTRRRSSTGRWSRIQRMDGMLAGGPGAVRFAIRRYQSTGGVQETGWVSASLDRLRLTAGVGGHPLRWGLGLLGRSRVVSLRRAAAARIEDPDLATLSSVSRPTEILAPVVIGSRRYAAASYRIGRTAGLACAVSEELVQAAFEGSTTRIAYGILGESRDGAAAGSVHLTRVLGNGLVQSELAVRESEGLQGGLRWSAVADRRENGRIWWDVVGKQPLLAPAAGDGVGRLRERSVRPDLTIRIGGSRREYAATVTWTRREPPAAVIGSRSASRSWSANLTARPKGMGAWNARLHGASRTYTCSGAKDDPLAPVPCRRRRHLRTHASMETDPGWERRGGGTWGFELGSDLETRSTCGGLVRHETSWWTGVFRRHAVRGPRSTRAAGSLGLLHADSGQATSVQVSPVWVGGPRRSLRGSGLWLGADLKLRARRLTWRLAGVVPVGVRGVSSGDEGGGLETRLELRTW